MTTAIELVAALREQGCQLDYVAGELKFLAAPHFTGEQRAQAVNLLREHKPEIIALLQVVAVPQDVIAECGSNECAGCYWIDQIIKLHPPRTCREFLQWRASWLAKGKRK